MFALDSSKVEYLNREGRESGYPYTAYFIESGEIFRSQCLKDFYKWVTSLIRVYLNDGYIAIIESENAWRTIHDKESYQEAIINGWLFQLEDQENKVITIDFRERAE